MSSIDRNLLIAECNKVLRPELFRDYCPNGLQIEGTNRISKIVSAVSASKAAIDYCADTKADALLVHHGVFWGKGETRLTGTLYNRAAALIRANCNLLAWHLPLDAHPTLGNNAEIARLLKIKQIKQLKPTDIVATGTLAKPVDSNVLLHILTNQFGAQSRLYGKHHPSIKSLSWCTGAGGDFIEQAAETGIQAFITGEVHEQHYHLAHELGISLFAAGHYATEKYGVQALAGYIKKQFAIEHEFFDQNNPI